MRNPNGYGTVTRLSGNRRKPFIVKKTTGFNEKGHPVYEIIGYAKTKEEGMMLLAEYNKDPWSVSNTNLTLKEIFELWKEKKAIKLQKANREKLSSAFKHCNQYVDMKYVNLRVMHMQDIVDGCNKGHSVQANIKTFFMHLDNFALELEISNKNYSKLIIVDPAPETNRANFTEEEIEKVWTLYNEYESGKEFSSIPSELIDTVLIFLYTGFRISELLNMKISDINLIEGTFKGGVKTNAGKNRIVPIHSSIYEIVRRRVSESKEYFITTQRGNKMVGAAYRTKFKAILNYMGINHQVHECRHTFATRLDSAGANKKCIDLMMGHTSKDVGNRVYNHKTLEELKEAIELIK